MNRKLLQQMISAGLLLLLVGCSAPVSPPTSLLPTATPETPTVLGKLIGPEGAITGAEVSLKSFQDEDCVKLAESTTALSESDKKQLEVCSGDFASTTSDTEGQYRFSEVSPGWYKLDFTWNLNSKPDINGPLAFRDGFFIGFFETVEMPIKYSALAQGNIFYFSGKEDMVINFDYGKP